MTPDPIATLNSIQQRIRAGEDVNADEMREVIHAMRTSRATVAETPSGRRTAAPKVDLQALFASMKAESESSSPTSPEPPEAA